MARLKLIEYLNNPTLLETISEEEMIAWAKEVPYAGLVQRLLAQKLAIQSARKDLAEEATTMAIISNANPNQVIKSIKDFKNLVLNKEVLTEPAEDSRFGHGKSDSEPKTLSDMEHATKQSSDALENAQLDTPEQNIQATVSQEVSTKQRSIESSKVIPNDLEEEELSDFAHWLSGLQSIAIEEEESDHLELENKELASVALAELLVSQGHNQRAIEMYEILILKNPQKSSFFADQIQKLKAL